jgi:FkbM family methyltransferase
MSQLISRICKTILLIFEIFSYIAENNKQYFENLLNEYYQKYLDRKPDQAGFEHYLKLLMNKQLNENTLKETFLESDEHKSFQQKYNAHKKLFLQNNTPYVYKGKFDILYNVDPLSMLDYEVTQQGIWKEFLILLLQKTLPQNAILFDIGANVGLSTLSFAKILASEGLVYSFEPNSQIKSKLLKNIELNNLKNIVVEEYALQNDPKILTQEFYIREALQEDGRINNGISSLKKNQYHNKHKQIVKTTTLDNYVNEHRIHSINLIKIDVEGGDSDVFYGGEKSIDEYKPIIIYEYSTMLDFQANLKNTQSCFEFLKSKNYVQFRIGNNNLTKFEHYDPLITDSDFICFYKNKIPDFI